MRRLAILSANLGLFTLICFFLAGVINQISAELLHVDRPSRVLPDAAASPTATARANHRAIVERNLFGSKLDAVDLAVPEPQPEELEETKLPLRLLGTVASEDAHVAKAAVESLNGRETEVLRIGGGVEQHEGVTVVAIERRRVILDNQGRREELRLDEENPAAARPTRRPTRTARRAPSPRRSGPTPAERESRLSERLQELQETAASPRTASNLFSQARILPKYEDGEMVGIELSSIKEGSFFSELGIQDGDVISEVNGIAINSPAASSQLLTQFGESEEFTVVVHSAEGEESVKTISSDELSGFLEE